MQEDYFIESVDQLKVLMPRTVCSAETEPIILVNPTDSLKTLQKGAVIGSAYEVIAFQEGKMHSEVSCSNVGPNDSLVNQDDHGEIRSCWSSEQEQTEEPTSQDIPGQFYESSVEKLNAEQRQKLKTLLCAHQDVFAEHDLDLETATAIKPTIDTGEPVQFTKDSRVAICLERAVPCFYFSAVLIFGVPFPFGD